LVDEARALVVAVDPSFLVRMPLGVSRHEIGVLHVAYRAALGVLARDQIDRLPPTPLLLLAEEVFEVTDIHRHRALLSAADFYHPRSRRPPGRRLRLGKNQGTGYTLRATRMTGLSIDGNRTVPWTR